MSCKLKPRELNDMARTYLLAHEEELGLEDLDAFEDAVRDLAAELEGAIIARWLEWRNRSRAKRAADRRAVNGWADDGGQQS